MTENSAAPIDDEVQKLIVAARSEGIARGMSDKFTVSLAEDQVKKHAASITARLRSAAPVVGRSPIGWDEVFNALETGFKNARVRWDEKLKEYNGELDNLDAYAVQMNALTVAVMALINGTENT
jgi:hypothetical protein